MTPVTAPSTPSEQAYNLAHVKRCFGILKSRFRYLDKSGGTLLYSPKKVCKIFVASAIPCTTSASPTVWRRFLILIIIVARHVALHHRWPDLSPPEVNTCMLSGGKMKMKSTSRQCNIHELHNFRYSYSCSFTAILATSHKYWNVLWNVRWWYTSQTGLCPADLLDVRIDSY